MVDTDDTDILRTMDNGRRTTPRVWHKLPTGELKSVCRYCTHHIAKKSHSVSISSTSSSIFLLLFSSSTLSCSCLYLSSIFFVQLVFILQGPRREQKTGIITSNNAYIKLSINPHLHAYDITQNYKQTRGAILQLYAWSLFLRPFLK